MSPERALFETPWVHVFEEDGPEGAVYRPEAGELPLSRRPRERLSLSPDGSARLVTSTPDDRLREVEASWTEAAGEVTVTTRSAGLVRTLRVRLRSSDCLIVR